VRYNYKADPREKHVGFIAEDVPELVAREGRKSLSPMDIVAVLTKVLQEKSEKMDALEATVVRLEAELNRLKLRDAMARE
jgi:BMFP domain-containing protein YqiC